MAVFQGLDELKNVTDRFSKADGGMEITKSLLKTIIDRLPILILVTNYNLEIVTANRLWLDMLGLTDNGSIAGSQLIDFSPIVAKSEMVEGYIGTVKTGKKFIVPHIPHPKEADKSFCLETMRISQYLVIVGVEKESHSEERCLSAT